MRRSFFASTVRESAPSNLFALRINCGNQGEIQTSMGTFVDDTGYYNIGTAFNTTNAIDNTTDDNLYQSERYAGDFTYTSLTIPNGTYTVRLHFAELFWTVTDRRIFDIFINNVLFLNDYEIVAVTGGAFIAVIEEKTNVAVSGGVIDVRLVSSKDNGKLNGIEFIQTA